MSRTRGPLAALLVAAVLALSGCGSKDAPPGDLLPDPATDASSATDATMAPEADTPADPTTPAAPSSPSDPPNQGGAGAEDPGLGSPGIPPCDLLDLPATTLPVIEDIAAGGPYDYPRNDGYTFQNREGILPEEDPDYYREFTVETPGLDHRGARRIVTGGFAETDPDHWYFTDDHYESFCEFDPDQGG